MDIQDSRKIKRGMTRYLILVVDASIAMHDKDFEPSRLKTSEEILSDFITEYFDQNPISHLSIIITKEGLAEKLTELSGNPKHHVQSLQDALDKGRGMASFQNALELAYKTLMFAILTKKVHLFFTQSSYRNIPKFGTREVLLVTGSISTCDPGDINETIDKLKNNKIRTSVISLSSEVYICKRIAEHTKGKFFVPLSKHNFRQMLFTFIQPPPECFEQKEVTLINMGFPQYSREQNFSICVW